MKTIQRFFLLLLSLFTGCSKEETKPVIHIQVIPPDGHTLAYDKIKVTLTNKETGFAYDAFCASTGLASFHVEYGYYTASVYHVTDADVVLSGRIDNLSLLPEQAGSALPVAELLLSKAQSNALLIKEIYYVGCEGQPDKQSGGIRQPEKGYSEDQYVTLCNNSDQTVYLDGVCIGMVDPINSMESPWMKHTDMKRIPVNNMIWQFPGNGEDYPLLPGEETTIATNAINHAGEEYGHHSSIDLSEVDWAFWDVSLDEQVISPGVTPMKLILKTSPEWKYSFSILGPTLMLFKIQGISAEAYINNPENREPRPQSSNKNRRYLMIPAEWVLDCVDCVENAKQVPYKRVPNELNHQAAYIPDGAYCGRSLIRKKTVDASGRAIYQDTNNSAEDMEVSAPTLKHRR